MKQLLVSLTLLSMSCSTNWRQKDFIKDINKSPDYADKIVATNPKEEKILEKFEVKPVEVEKNTEKKAKSLPVLTKKKLVKKEVQKKSPEIKKTTLKSPPEDYPSEMLEINAKAKKVWDLYRPNHYINQKSYLDINYLGMTVGKIMIHNQGKKMINNQEVWHFYARFKSAPFYSNIYELDDTVDTYVTTDNFLSNKFSLIQRESTQDIDDIQFHDRDQFKTFWFFKQKKSNGAKKEKKVEKPIPFYSTDPFSVIFFYQGLPLKNGDVYEIPLINKGKILILKSVVEGREVIKTNKTKYRAIRVRATTKYTGDTLKSGDLYFWFSDDNYRTFIKAKAKIKIGSVTADLVDN